jgi:hypothetical protein
MIDRDPRGQKTLASLTEFLALVGRGIGAVEGAPDRSLGGWRVR